MGADRADAAEDSATYSYRPSPMGAPRVFKLAGDGIDWAFGRSEGHIAFRDVRRLRMSFKPTGMQSHRFITEIWAEGVPKLKIISSSWKSMLEQERLDQAYAEFIVELHRRMAAAAVPARFEQGAPALLYWPSAIVFVIVIIGVAGLIVRAIEAGTWGGAAFVTAFLVFFLWQGGNFFRRNRPGVYRPDTPPVALMPKS